MNSTNPNIISFFNPNASTHDTVANQSRRSDNDGNPIVDNATLLSRINSSNVNGISIRVQDDAHVQVRINRLNTTQQVSASRVRSINNQQRSINHQYSITFSGGRGRLSFDSSGQLLQSLRSLHPHLRNQALIQLNRHILGHEFRMNDGHANTPITSTSARHFTPIHSSRNSNALPSSINVRLATASENNLSENISSNFGVNRVREGVHDIRRRGTNNRTAQGGRSGTNVLFSQSGSRQNQSQGQQGRNNNAEHFDFLTGTINELINAFSDNDNALNHNDINQVNEMLVPGRLQQIFTNTQTENNRAELFPSNRFNPDLERLNQPLNNIAYIRLRVRRHTNLYNNEQRERAEISLPDFASLANRSQLNSAAQINAYLHRNCPVSLSSFSEIQQPVQLGVHVYEYSSLVQSVQSIFNASQRIQDPFRNTYPDVQSLIHQIRAIDVDPIVLSRQMQEPPNQEEQTTELLAAERIENFTRYPNFSHIQHRLNLSRASDFFDFYDQQCPITHCNALSLSEPVRLGRVFYEYSALIGALENSSASNSAEVIDPLGNRYPNREAVVQQIEAVDIDHARLDQWLEERF